MSLLDLLKKKFSIKEISGDDSPIPRLKDEPGKGVSRPSDRSRKSLSGDKSINGNQLTIRHLKVDFSDAEYSFLKAAAFSTGKSIGAYVRDCVLAELKTKKVQDSVRDFFEANLL